MPQHVKTKTNAAKDLGLALKLLENRDANPLAASKTGTNAEEDPSVASKLLENGDADIVLASKVKAFENQMLREDPSDNL